MPRTLVEHFGSTAKSRSIANPKALAILVFRYADCFFNDLMVRGRRELRRAEFDGQLVKLAREAEGHLVILVVHSGAGVHADVEAFVRR